MKVCRHEFVEITLVYSWTITCQRKLLVEDHGRGLGLVLGSDEWSGDVEWSRDVSGWLWVVTGHWSVGTSRWLYGMAVDRRLFCGSTLVRVICCRLLLLLLVLWLTHAVGARRLFLTDELVTWQTTLPAQTTSHCLTTFHRLTTKVTRRHWTTLQHHTDTHTDTQLRRTLLAPI